ncbi:MAG TPA: glycosyltransferase family 39 protein [Chloroflexota bacterium]|jgi:4-amino-4-deoxy-L-arabinose transferase-like glycosyltransferase|nr:glycosyltransferase family 39 protein [Chloroflexota bacterium]
MPNVQGTARASSWLVIAALAGVFLTALAVRFWSLDWQLPFAFHPDEGHYVWKAEEMFREGTLNPRYFRNPSLFTYTILGELKIGEAAGAIQPRAEGGPGLFQAPSIYMYLGRATSALLGGISVLVVYGLGRELVSASTGLLAALFLAMNFLHVRDSHFATNDVPAVALALVSVWLSARSLDRPSVSGFLWAGLFGGLATSAKYSMGLYLLPLALAWLLSRPAGWSMSQRVLAAVLAGVASGVGFLAGTPYSLLTWDKFKADFFVQMRLGGEGWEGQSSASVPQLYLDTLLTGVGWPLMALAAIGIVLALKRDWRLTLLLLSFPLGYGLFMARQQLFFARFALPLAPFFAIFGAYAVMELGRRLSDFRARAIVTVGLVAAVLIPAVGQIATHNLLIARPDTRVEAFDWLRSSVPSKSKLAIEDYTIRDRRPRAYQDDGRFFDTDLINVNDIRDPNSVLLGSFAYVVTSSFNQDRFTSDPQRFPRQNAFYQALDTQARLVAEFRPGKGGTSIPFDIEDLYTPFWHLERYERMGPTVRVYELAS